MKKVFILAVLAAGFCTQVFAQADVKVSVKDIQTKAPIPKASIFSGNKVLAIADDEGNFQAAANSVVTVSSVGYITKIVKLPAAAEYTIYLEKSSVDLNTIEITATSNLNKGILYQPSSITKLTPTELKRSTGLFLDDAINGNVPGVTMNRRAVSSGQQFNIRGYGNGSRGARGISSNFDGQGYKVYLNGIPITDAEGITVLDDIDFGSVGNVEVVKGPAGTLYGLAIAGVVNLNTMKPEKGKTSVGQEVLIGNYGLQRYTTRFQTAGANSSILVNYGHQESDGFTIHNKSHKDFVNVAADFQPNEKQLISAYFGYSNSYDERSGELTVAQYNAKDYSGNVEYIKRNGHSQVYSIRAGLSHTYMFNSTISNTTTVFGTSFNTNSSSAAGWTDKTSTNLGVRSTFNTKFSVGNGASLSGVTGVETQRQYAQTVGYTMVKNPLDTASVWKWGNPYYWIIGASTSNGQTVTGNLSLFTEWTLALPKDFSITAGIGFSKMKVQLDDRFYVANKPTHFDTTYTNMFSPHVAINKVISKQVSVYAAYSRGYKAPVSSYYFIPFASAFASQTGIVNSHLKPEVGDQFEIGTKGTLFKSKLSYQIAFFNAIFSNKMTTVAVPYDASTTLFSYVTNGGKQDHKGIEAQVRYTAYESASGFFRSVTPFGNLAWSDYNYKDYKFHILASNKDSLVDYSNKPVAGVARIVGNLGIDVDTKPGVYANITWFYKDGMPVTSDGIYQATSYSLLNAKLGFRHNLGKHFDLDAYFGVNNIAETQYPIMVFINQIPDAFIAAPAKANYFGGVNLSYNF